jgi:multidrug resistance efflux pump
MTLHTSMPTSSISPRKSAAGSLLYRSKENSHVKKGDLLFQIDPVPYKLTVDQARANVEIAKAALETQRRWRVQTGARVGGGCVGCMLPDRQDQVPRALPDHL